MIDSPLVALALVFSVIGALSSPETGTLVTLGALGTVAIAALAAAALFASLTAGGPSAAVGALGRPRRAIDISTPLPQSDPDAPGRSRPRAPGCAAVAA